MLVSSPSLGQSGGGSSSTTGSAAVETAVDAYATRVLKASTPPETFFDTSLGHYVASVFRCTEIQSSCRAVTELDVTSLAEFESLLELLEDQCNMKRDVATTALKSIAEAVVTGVVPYDSSSSRGNGGGAGFYSITGSTIGGTSLDSFQSMKASLPLLQTTDTLEQISIDPYTPTATGTPSQLKPDNLIPLDLLGFLDDPSTQQVQQQLQEEQKTNGATEEAFPPLGAVSNEIANSRSKHSVSKKGRGKNKGTSKNSKSDKDLAAALFRPSRTRHNSIENEEALQSLSSIPGPGFNDITSQQQGQPQNFNNQYFQQQLDSCVEILLSMNSDVGEGAATEAAVMANGDFNVAQYIVDKALSAPPVCRHMLHDGCYRSDCQFSHDVDGHTCLFWLRGRCTKPVSSCKFLHGFHPKLMEGLPANMVGASSQNMMGTNDQRIVTGSSPAPIGYSQPPYAVPSGVGSATLTPSVSQNQHIMPLLWQQNRPPPSLADSSSVTSNSNGGTSFSFANVASRGYDNYQFVASSPLQQRPPTSLESSSTSRSSNSNIPTVRIPQDLWTAHENRDASVFHIADPLERYRQVSAAAGNRRDDVIDLHFQSTKTFGAVLEQVLPTRLQQSTTSEGIWIVTGTGHHVGSKTHQKGGGALERAVIQWLQEQGYHFSRGKDRNGLGGAVLVKPL